MLKPPFNYPGSKRMLAGWILGHFPRHHTYAEPFAGSASVFFAKPPSRSEYLNDLNGHIVRFFRVLRDEDQARSLARSLALTPYSRREFEESFESAADPVEFARRFVLRHQMSLSANGGARYSSGWKHNGPRNPHGGAIAGWLDLPARVLECAERLREAFIDESDAVEFIARLNAPGVLLYVDPPYPEEVRATSKPLYQQEMLDPADHLLLLDALRAHQGFVVLSGYETPLYTDHLPGWSRVTSAAITQLGAAREEVLWINPAAQQALTAPPLF